MSRFTENLGHTLDALGIHGRCVLCRETGLDSPVALCRSCNAALPRSTRPCPTCLRDHGRHSHSLLDNEPCLACRREPLPWQRLITPFRFEPPMSFLVPRIKKVRGLIETRVLASLAISAIRHDYTCRPLPEAVIPIPMTRTRRLVRSFNHSEQLARFYGRALEIPVAARALKRRKGGPPQRHLARAERLKNVRGAFVARDTAKRLRHIALVDDVMTTGATVVAATQALRRVGVDQIDVWVTAYTPDR